MRKKSAVRRLINTFFDGSPANAVVNLLGSQGDSLSVDDIRSIEQEIAQAKERLTPMEAILLHLFEADWLSLRDVLRLGLLSGLFTLAALIAFPRNAASRRALLIAAVTSLTTLPWLLGVTSGVWTLEVDAIPVVTLATALPNLLLWLWLLIAVVRIGYYYMSTRRELQYVAACPIITANHPQEILKPLCQALDMPIPELRLAAAACSTSLVGPTIMLPNEWQTWDDKTLGAVLAHELIHIHRHDDRWMIVTRLLVMAYWWMPWIRLLARKYLVVMEESCDDAASELTGKPVNYAQALAAAAGYSYRNRFDSNQYARAPTGRSSGAIC